jgi:hypothetical protein
MVLLLVVLSAGCSGIAQNIKSTLTNEGPVLVAPQRTPMELPDHAKLAVAALLQQMRHEAVTTAVFDAPGSHDIQESFSYKGFAVSNVDIAKQILVKENSQAAIINLGGFVHFRDEAARGASVAFEMHYKVSKKSDDLPVILKSYTSNVTPTYPLVAAFYIPAETFRKRAGALPDSFPAYLRFAQENAIDMSLGGMQEGITSHMKQSLIVLIFCFDRLPPEALLDVTVDDYRVTPVEMDFNGWRILAVGGKGPLFTPSEPFFIDVYYFKRATAFFSREHIARFSSLQQDLQSGWRKALNQSKRGPDGVARALGAQGPIGKGLRLLDVRRYSDAVVVQTRLQELGYYKMRIDGDFGKGSRAALRNWTRDNLGRESEVLTLDIQKELFRGTGL